MSVELVDQVDGKDLYAKRAEQDENGLNIDQYYAKKTEIPEVPVQDVKVNGSSVVDEHGVANVDLSGLATKQEVTDGLATKQDTINDLSDIRAGAEKGATSVQDVEVDGTSVVNANGVAEIDLSDYAHQSDIPDVPVQDVEVNGASVVNANGVAEVTVPTKTSDLQNDSNFITASDVPAQQQSDWNQSNSSAVDYIKNKPQNLVQDADYVHTDNNYTDQDEAKLAGIEAGAEVNVQSDWNQTNSSADDYIKNKPQNLVQDADYVHTDNNFTDQDEAKLAGIEAGAEVNVQSDWSEADSSADDYIKNKPDLSIYAEKSDLATVATTGDYDDLQNKPTIPAAQVQSDYGQTDSSAVDYIKNKPDLSIYAEKSELAAVATTGDYDDLQNKPSIPAAQVQSDWAQSDSSAVDYIKNKPQNLVQDASYVHTDNNFTNNDKNKLDGIETGAEVNVQSDWNQSDSSADDYIKNKPTIPVVPTLVEGANITITQNGNTITIANKMTAGDGINIDANGVISVDADDLNIDYWHGGSSSAIVGSNLNTGVSAVSYRGSNIYASSGAITLKKGTYAVHAFVKVNNNSVSIDPNLYKFSINGGITGGAPIKTVELDNSFTHEEVYELSFMTFNTSDTDAALVLTTDALTALAGLNVSLPYIQVYCLNGLVGASGGGGSGTANVAITSSDHSVTVNETTIGDTSSFDLSVPQQVQSNWNESNQNSKAFIQNKPSIPSKTSDLANDSGFITASQVPAQQQADWNQSDSSAVDYIQNKPTIPSKTSDLQNDSGFITASQVPAQVQSDWSETVTTDPSYIRNKPASTTLVAGTNITLTPDAVNHTLTISASGGGTQVQSNWNEVDTTSPAYIQNKPTIPAAQVQSDWTESDNTDPSYVQNKPEEMTLVAGSNVTITPDAANHTLTIAASGGASYSAGNMISLANNTVAVSTTAGITDIQLVNALPAQPVATVLYLIPET